MTIERKGDNTNDYASHFPTIILIGLMGCGKTTIGRYLAKAYHIPFIDSDIEIEKAAQLKIPEIFSRYGEQEFRKGEERVLKRILNKKSCVISTGGGAWINAKTRALIRQHPNCCVIWLKTPINILLKRVAENNNRPLLQNPNPYQVLKKLAQKRHPFYAQADIIINCKNKNIDDIMTCITTEINNHTPLDYLTLNLKNHTYRIYTGSHLLSHIPHLIMPYIKGNHAVIITDENVAKFHLDKLKKSLSEITHLNPDFKYEIITIKPGEKSKSFHCYQETIEKLLSFGIDRKTLLIAFGGGVVGDLTGFIAATALRGIPFIQIPTTLLSQVDSSVGGKTGINAPSGKNLVGAFWQPQLVLADATILQTLPKRQMIAGYGEIIKSALIDGKDFFAWCLQHGKEIIDGVPSILAEAVRRTCHFKADIIKIDEHETKAHGGRALLNLGHTFGHALEKDYSYNDRLLHGEAVLIGLDLAMDFSAQQGFLDKNIYETLHKHLKDLNLPCSIKDLPAIPKADIFIKNMVYDKKAKNRQPGFILARDVGNIFMTYDVNMNDIYNFLIKHGCKAS